jgi:hypothetical protein
VDGLGLAAHHQLQIAPPNSENLMLDEPALRTAIASLITPPPFAAGPRAATWRRGRHRAGGQTRRDRVGPAGQDDRHARPEHDPRRIGIGHEAEALGQHSCRFQVGNDEDVGLSGHGRVDLLDLGGAEVDRVVERERPVEDAAGDLAALGHLAQAAASMVDGTFGLIVSIAERIATSGFRHAQRMSEVDRVLHDVHLVLERRKDVHRCVGDDDDAVDRGTSMMKQWLTRRLVRSPVSRFTTAAMISSECRLPFISISALPSRARRTAVSAEATLCGASTTSKAECRS